MAERTPKPSNIDAAGANYVERIENLQGAIEDIMDAAREDCSEHRDDLKQLFKDAKNDGYSAKVLKAVVAARKARRKLSAGDKDQFDKVRHALGDFSTTPLGQAAVAADGGAQATA
jgi:uncharacterized protein (UPF0335 family)